MLEETLNPFDLVRDRDQEREKDMEAQAAIKGLKKPKDAEINEKVNPDDLSAISIFRDDFCFTEKVPIDPNVFFKSESASFSYFPKNGDEEKEQNLKRIQRLIDKHEPFIQLQKLIFLVAKYTQKSPSKLFGKEEVALYKKIFGSDPKSNICREEDENNEVLLRKRLDEFLQPYYHKLDLQKNEEELDLFYRQYQMYMNLFPRIYGLPHDQVASYQTMLNNHVDDTKINQRDYAALVKALVNKVDRENTQFKNELFDFNKTYYLIAKFDLDIEENNTAGDHLIKYPKN